MRTQLRATDCESDLGIIVSSHGMLYEQLNSAISKANKVLGLMKNTFKSWPDEIVLIVYPTFIRPRLELVALV